MPKLNPPASAQAKQLPVVRPQAVRAGISPFSLLQPGLGLNILPVVYWLLINICGDDDVCLQCIQPGRYNQSGFAGARDSEWQWHQLNHMHICTLIQTHNHTSTPPLGFLQAGYPSYRPTNSVKALKEVTVKLTYDDYLRNKHYCPMVMKYWAAASSHCGLIWWLGDIYDSGKW